MQDTASLQQIASAFIACQAATSNMDIITITKLHTAKFRTFAAAEAKFVIQPPIGWYITTFGYFSILQNEFVNNIVSNLEHDHVTAMGLYKAGVW